MPTASSLPYDALFLAFQSALAGRYSIERELGRGGSGIVFLAREVPPALRAFVKRHGRIDSGLAILAPMGMVVLAAIVGSFTSYAGGWTG